MLGLTGCPSVNIIGLVDLFGAPFNEAEVGDEVTVHIPFNFTESGDEADFNFSCSVIDADGQDSNAVENVAFGGIGSPAQLSFKIKDTAPAQPVYIKLLAVRQELTGPLGFFFASNDTEVFYIRNLGTIGALASRSCRKPLVGWRA